MDFSAIKKDTLRHAYLLEGAHEDVLPALRAHLIEEGITEGKGIDARVIPVFYIDDARTLRADQQMTRDGLKIFIIAFDRMIEAAQHALLKTLEEPTAGTHFFFIGRSRDLLLPTVVSRLITLKPMGREDNSARDDIARKYLASDIVGRAELLKKVIDAARESDNDEDKATARRKLIRFLDALERILVDAMRQGKVHATVFSDAANVVLSAKRDLADPSPSIKMIFEHLALRMPRISL
jgi:hypothetical protein